MVTKKAMILKALSHIKDFDSIKSISVKVDLNDSSSFESFRKMYRWTKYTKEQWLFKEVNSIVRNNPYDDTRPAIWQPDLSIKNLKSIKVSVSYK